MFLVSLYFVFARRKENIEDSPLAFFLCKKVTRREEGARLFCPMDRLFSGGEGVGERALVIGDTALFYNDIPLH